jgi:hypothetical protein
LSSVKRPRPLIFFSVFVKRSERFSNINDSNINFAQKISSIIPVQLISESRSYAFNVMVNLI